MTRKRAACLPAASVPVAILIVLPAALWSSGCKEEKQGTAPVLGPDHMGWKNPQCETCHWLPVERHSAVEPHTCAGCHGSNGACDPNAPGIVQEHEPADDCMSCHGNRHGYTEAVQCAACHFSGLGLDSCTGAADAADVPADAPDAPPDASDGPPDQVDVPPDSDEPVPDVDDAAADAPGPELSTAVESGCFGWPDEAFTIENHAAVTTSLGEGELAVELQLRHVDGTETTLSSLLAEKPVLMVFGSFT